MRDILEKATENSDAARLPRVWRERGPCPSSAQSSHTKPRCFGVGTFFFFWQALPFSLRHLPFVDILFSLYVHKRWPPKSRKRLQSLLSARRRRPPHRWTRSPTFSYFLYICLLSLSHQRPSPPLQQRLAGTLSTISISRSTNLQKKTPKRPRIEHCSSSTSLWMPQSLRSASYSNPMDEWSPFTL